jgi:hypothetical protein
MTSIKKEINMFVLFRIVCDSEMRIVASTASMLEEPTRGN